MFNDTNSNRTSLPPNFARVLMVSGVSLTLQELQQLLRTSSTKLDDRSYDPGNFLVPRKIQAIEQDGVPLVVRYGYNVSPIEAETTSFVAEHTSVRVPRIFAVFAEPCEGSNRIITYIVEERLPGTTLLDALPTLDEHSRETITGELRTIFSQLATSSNLRNRLGPLRGPWHRGNANFAWLLDHHPCSEDDARDTEGFVRYWLNIAKKRPLTAHRASDRLLEPYDFSKPPVFSHGDLQPSNIMVRDGHVAGIIDWAEAGWYPYFWDAYNLLKSTYQLWAVRSIWQPMAASLCDLNMCEARCIWQLLTLVDDGS